jgi:hypothetical protein
VSEPPGKRIGPSFDSLAAPHAYSWDLRGPMTSVPGHVNLASLLTGQDLEAINTFAVRQKVVPQPLPTPEMR